MQLQNNTIVLAAIHVAIIGLGGVAAQTLFDSAHEKLVGRSTPRV